MEEEEFRSLQKDWYRKLKNFGFTDIETPINGQAENAVITRCSGDITLHTYENGFEYYRLAGHFFHDFDFPTAFDRFIWEKHAEGIEMRSIAALAEVAGFGRMPHTRVYRAIQRLRCLMLDLYEVRPRKTGVK